VTDERHTIIFGSLEIAFTLIRTSRRRIKITVGPDRQVSVEAPANLELVKVLERVRRRAAWIVRQLEYFRRFQPLPTPRQYVSGETHLYLGRQYRLKLFPSEKEGVKLIRGYFQVFAQDPKDKAKVERLMNRWLDRHGRAIIADRLARCHAELKRYDVPEPVTITFRRMEKRWGSCTKAGGLLFNTEMAHVPIPCIDYVVNHELCHLKHPNHSPAFYALLSQVMPDWQKRKERLETAIL
jgi:hypothetical protein